MQNKMSIMVTGGAGFVGSHLSRKLIGQGHQVTVVDNLSTGCKENIADLMEYDRFSFIEHDIVFPLDFTEPINQIYNLASPASPVHYQADSVQTTKTNVLGSLHMLELAKKYKATILQASTSEVYGDPLMHPQVESYWGNVNPIGIRACYDEAKRCAETLFFDYQRMYGVSIKVARIFNTYGPVMDPCDGRVVSNFIVAALRGEPITIYGDGSQTRSFCYVDDLIEGLIRLMNSSTSVTGPINVGNPGEFTVLALAKMVIELTQSSSPLVYKPLPQDDPVRRRPSIDKAKQLLEWQPTVPLRDGLIKTIDYFSTMLVRRKEKRDVGHAKVVNRHSPVPRTRQCC